MKKYIEKLRTGYVLCSIDNNGTTVYLRSLHEPGKWEIVSDIEIATKYTSSDAADMSYDFYMAELGTNAGKFVKLPFEIEYRLINESE